jgi:hypothetical protein
MPDRARAQRVQELRKLASSVGGCTERANCCAAVEQDLLYRAEARSQTGMASSLRNPGFTDIEDRICKPACVDFRCDRRETAAVVSVVVIEAASCKRAGSYGKGESEMDEQRRLEGAEARVAPVRS